MRNAVPNEAQHADKGRSRKEVRLNVQSILGQRLWLSLSLRTESPSGPAEGTTVSAFGSNGGMAEFVNQHIRDAESITEYRRDEDLCGFVSTHAVREALAYRLALGGNGSPRGEPD